MDDIGISESSADQKITKATIEAHKRAYAGALTYDLDPTSFAGYMTTIVRNGDDTVESVTLS